MSKTIIDLSVLPENARREIMDFYDFLKKKYTEEGCKEIDFSRLVPREIKPFDLPKRDELYDRKSLL